MQKIPWMRGEQGPDRQGQEYEKAPFEQLLALDIERHHKLDL